MCHFPIFLCFPECAFSQPSFPNVVDSSLLFPSRSVVADKLFISTHINKKGTFCGWLSTFVTLLYRNVCKNNWVNVKTNTVHLIWWVPAFIYAGHYTWTRVQVCEEAGHSTDLVGKGGRAGNSTWWDEPLSPESVWLGLGAPLLSVFSLHGFVCGLSETFQESHSQLHGGNECKRRVWWLLEHLFNYILNTVKFVLLESVVHFKQQKKRLSFLKLRK